MFSGIDLDLYFEGGLRITFGRKLEHQVHGVSGLMSIKVTQPCERVTHGIDRATDGPRLCLDQVNVF